MWEKLCQKLEGWAVGAFIFVFFDNIGFFSFIRIKMGAP